MKSEACQLKSTVKSTVKSSQRSSQVSGQLKSTVKSMVKSMVKSSQRSSQVNGQLKSTVNSSQRSSQVKSSRVKSSQRPNQVKSSHQSSPVQSSPPPGQSRAGAFCAEQNWEGEVDTTAPSTGAAVQPAQAQGYIHMYMCTYTCIYIHTYLRRGSPWALRRKAGRSRLDARLWLSTSGLEPRTSERRVQGTGHREGYVCGARTED